MVWKRIGYFLLTNLLVLLVLGLVLSLTGLDTGISAYGLNLGTLLVFSAVFGFGGAFLSLALSRWIAKRVFGVRLVDASATDPTARWLYDTVARLSRQAGLPKTPEVGVYFSDEVNAFATGPSRSRSLVAVSSGLILRMDRREVEGVLAHEVAHIANGDMVTLTLLQGVLNTFVIFLSRVIGFVIGRMVGGRAEGLVRLLAILALQVLFGILASLVVAAFSRQREFRADAGGARLAGREAMVSALQRLRAHSGAVDDAQPAFAAMKIHGLPGWARLFSTHPPLEERIARLNRA
ncbi:MAG: protease HtpX [Fimbriimonadales bacterium]|nr:protease HtpX [Fimbriimonadales bacterium]